MSLIAIGYPAEVRGKPTFAKVLNDYFDNGGKGEAISEPWKAEATRRQYINDYRKRLLPNMDPYRPLCDYTEEYVIDQLRKIEKKYSYGADVVAHYRLLFGRVYYAAVDNEIIEDKLFWNDVRNGKPGISGNQSPKDKFSIQKRTLTMHEEVKLLKWIKAHKAENLSGEIMGLLLMYNLPLRNNEACGLNYGDIHVIKEYGIPVIYVYKSTMRDSNQLKPGGKTDNMMRILPLLDIVYEKIVERKIYIQKQIEMGLFKLPEGCNSVDDLPIACRGGNYGERCSTKDLSASAGKLFEELGITKLREGKSEFLDKSGIEEESFSAYLFRKNALNHLWCLSFTKDEMEYCMGHSMSGFVKRSDYSNGDKLNRMYEKLKMHPANVLFGRGTSHIDKKLTMHPTSSIMKQRGKLNILDVDFCDEAEIRFQPVEPEDIISISIDDDMIYTIESSYMFNLNKMDEVVDISGERCKKYLKVFEEGD